MAFWRNHGYAGGGLRDPSIYSHTIQWNLWVAEACKAFNVAGKRIHWLQRLHRSLNDNYDAEARQTGAAIISNFIVMLSQRSSGYSSLSAEESFFFNLYFNQLAVSIHITFWPHCTNSNMKQDSSEAQYHSLSHRYSCIDTLIDFHLQKIQRIFVTKCMCT